MRVLALDSAFGGLSVAIAQGGVCVANRLGSPDMKAAESLPGLVRSVLSDAGLKLASMDRIAVTLGPGGFTSLRAGLAFAKGLAMGAGKPLLGFTTLEALAARLESGDTPIVAAIDAKRDELFLQVFDAGMAALSEAMVVPLAQLPDAVNWPERFRVCGSGASFVVARFADRASDVQIATPDASALAVYCQRFAPDQRPADAVYLRPADARPMA